MASSQKFIARNRAPRVQIEYDVELYGAEKKVQLPFVMGVMSDLSGKSEAPQPSVADRKFLEIDVDNFDSRMKSMKPRAAFTVPNTLTGEGNMAVDITFESMDDFSPAAIAAKVEPLKKLLDARTQLSNLMTYMDGKSGAEDLLEKVLQDRNLLTALVSGSATEMAQSSVLQGLRAQGLQAQQAAKEAAALAEADSQTALDALRAATPKAAEADDDTGAALDALRAATPMATEADDDTGAALDALRAATPKAAETTDDTGAALDALRAATPKVAEANDDTGAALDALRAATPKAAETTDDTGAALDALRAATPKAAEADDDTGAALDALRAATPKAAEANDDTGAALDALRAATLVQVEAAQEAVEEDPLADLLADAAPMATDEPEDPLAGLDGIATDPDDDPLADLLADAAPTMHDIETEVEKTGISALIEPQEEDALAALLNDAEPEVSDPHLDDTAGNPPEADPLDHVDDLLDENSPGDEDEEDPLAEFLADDAPEVAEAVDDPLADLDDLLGEKEAPPVATAPSSPEMDGSMHIAAAPPLNDLIEPQVEETAVHSSAPDSELNDLLGDLEVAESTEVGADPSDELDDLLAEAAAPDEPEEDPLEALLADGDSSDALNDLLAEAAAPDEPEEDPLEALLADGDASDALDDMLAEAATPDEPEEDPLGALLADSDPSDALDDLLAEAAAPDEPEEDPLEALLADGDPSDALDDLLADFATPEPETQDSPSLDAADVADPLADLDALLGPSAGLPAGENPVVEAEVEEDALSLLDDLLGDPAPAVATSTPSRKPGQPTLTAPQPSAEALDRPRFRMAIFGDFSGRAARGAIEVGDALANRRAIELDVDTVEEVIEGFATTLVLPIGPEGKGISVKLGGLDDLHPDELVDNLELFDALKGLRAQLSNPSTAASAVRNMQGWGESFTLPAAATHGRSSASSIPADKKLSDFQKLIGDTTGRLSQASPIDDLIGQIVGPHIVPGPNPEAEALKASVDEAMSSAMRLVLHHPEFQAIESQWRMLDLLARRIETDVKLTITLYDVSAEEIAADLAAEDDLAKTGLFRLLNEPVLDEGSIGYSAMFGMYAFEETPPHADLLGRLARIAAHVQAPFFTSMTPGFMEIPLADRHHLTASAWDKLRQMPEAGYLGLASPRFMLRRPYGKKTDPIDAFAFEEFTQSEGLKGLLWANPTALVAILLAQAWKEGGPKMTLGEVMSLDDIPFQYVTDQHGDQVALPCTERNLTEARTQLVVGRGYMPVVSIRGRDVVRLASFQSLTGDEIAGPWSAPRLARTAPDASPLDVEMEVKAQEVAEGEPATDDEDDLDALLAGFGDIAAPTDPDSVDAELAALLEGL